MEAQDKSRGSDRLDGYVNLQTGQGIPGGPDKASNSVYIQEPLISWQELADRYLDPLTARIIDRLPDDATREEINIVGEDESGADLASVRSEFEDLDVRGNLGNAWRWARLFRGSILFMDVLGSGKMDEPLILANATQLRSLQVIEAEHILPTGFHNGLGSRSFARPEFYQVTIPHATGSAFKNIHRSRVIRFDGVKVPLSKMIENDGWGPSVVDRVNDAVSSLGDTMRNARSILHTISKEFLKIKGLNVKLCGTTQDITTVQAAISAVRNQMDNYHLGAIDMDDDLVERTRTVTGLDMLIDRFVDAVVRATDMPRTVLLGEQPGGLNASGDSEIRTWYDFVASQQPRVLTPAINRLLKVIFAIRANKGEVVPAEWTIEYAPLWQPSEQEVAATELVRAQTASILLADGIVSVPEIRTAMISRGVLPDDAGEEPPEEDDENEVEALKAQMKAMQAPSEASERPEA